MTETISLSYRLSLIDFMRASEAHWRVWDWEQRQM